MSTWTLVAAWNWLVVDVRGVGGVPRAAAGRTGRRAREVRAARVEPVGGIDGAATGGDLHARAARLGAGRRILRRVGSTYVRAYWPHRRVPPSFWSYQDGRHRDLRPPASRPGRSGSSARGRRSAVSDRLLERVARLGVDDHAEGVTVLAVGVHVPRQARRRRRSRIQRSFAASPVAKVVARAARGHLRREREPAASPAAPCRGCASAVTSGDVSSSFAPADGAVVDGDQAPVAGDVGVEAGVVGLDPVDRLVVARGA